MSKRKQSSLGPEYAAPWTDGAVQYGPTSPRSGRMVSHEQAEREYQEMHGAIGSPGLWSYDQEAKMRGAAGCRQPTAPGRYDDAEMQRFADAESSRWTDLELQVYALFWGGKLSYGQIGRQLNRSKERIRECVQRLRSRLQRWTETPGVSR